MPLPPVRAVLWDFGGVITASPFAAFNRYEAADLAVVGKSAISLLTNF